MQTKNSGNRFPGESHGTARGRSAFGPLDRSLEFHGPSIGPIVSKRSYTTAVSVSSITSGSFGFPYRTARSTPATTSAMPRTVCAL
jgi:hypothetical protein